MKPKRLFVVYQEAGYEEAIAEVTSLTSTAREYVASKAVPRKWRWRLIATRNGQKVAGSQENFDSNGNALRAARREASLYQPGVAAVEVAE